MIEKAMCNLLIPFAFEKTEWSRIDDCKGEPSKEKIVQIKENGKYGSREWFSYCFKNLPVNETFQMGDSPLLNNKGGTLVKRIEFNQPMRSILGLHKNEKRMCSLKKERINFKIPKARI